MGDRVLLVIRRDQVKLYEYILGSVGQNLGVDVVLERREGERRQGGGQLPERRRTDRRRTTAARDYPALGYRLVRIAEAREPAPAEPAMPAAGRGLFSSRIRLDDLFPSRCDDPLSR